MKLLGEEQLVNGPNKSQQGDRGTAREEGNHFEGKEGGKRKGKLA